MLNIPSGPPNASMFSIIVFVKYINVNPTITTAKVGASPMALETRNPISAPNSVPVISTSQKGHAKLIAIRAAKYDEIAILATVIKCRCPTL
jgi:hypothetical protein